MPKIREAINRDFEVGQMRLKPNHWPTVKFDDVVTITKGVSYKGKDLNLPGPKLLGLGEFQPGGGANLESVRTYGGEFKNHHVVRPGDLLVALTDVTQTGDVLGSPLLVPSSAGQECLFTHHIGHVAVNNSDADRRFLYYLLKGPHFASFARGYATGTTVRTLNPKDIAYFEFSLPTVAEQRTIAYVLGTLDAKIELNRRMTENLEAKIRALFKSWFVDFEPVRTKMEGHWQFGNSFPGYPADFYDIFPERFVESDLGEIPEGWNVKTLGEVAMQHRLGVKPQEIDEELPYVALEHMPKRCIALNRWSNAVALGSGKYKFDKEDILFGKLRPYFHKVAVAPLDGVCSTDIVVVKPKSELWFGFVLGHTSSAEFVDYTDATSTGTRMPRTNWADMARYKVVLPTVEVSKVFTDLVYPYVKRIVAAIHESHSLATQRDTLLPKLVSRS